MAVDITTLLALPEKQRRKLAEQLWDSLSPDSSIATEDKEIISLLEQRWQNIQSEKSRTYSQAELKEMIKKHRSK